MRNHVCPWWLGYMLINPIRRCIQNPDDILGKYVKQNMKVLDMGCGMGYFSLPLAMLVGKQGKVLCIDMQKKMIEALRKRSKKAGLEHQIEVRTCTQHSLRLNDIKEELDFVLCFAVVHEVPDQDRLFREINQVLKLGGKLLVSEPKGHVKEKDFAGSVELAEKLGFGVIERPVVGKSHAVVLQKR